MNQKHDLENDDCYVNLEVTTEERQRIDKVMERRLLGKSVNYRKQEENDLRIYIIKKYNVLPIGWLGFDPARKTVFARKLTNDEVMELAQ